MNQTVIRWFPALTPDPVAASFIQSAIGSNRRMRHARLEIHEPDDVDVPETIQIINQNPARMISPADVRDLIEACLS